MGELTGYWSDNHLHINIDIQGNILRSVLNEGHLKMIEDGKDFQINGVDVYNEGNLVYIPFTITNNITSVGVDVNSLFDLAENAVEKEIKKQNPIDKTIPIDDPKWRNAIENARNFNMRDVDKFTKTTIDVPKDGDPVSLYGRVHSIVYMSDKEGLGEDQQYVHRFKEPCPLLVHSGSNKKPVYIIFGGKTYVSEPGDNSGEAPGWMID